MAAMQHLKAMEVKAGTAAAEPAAEAPTNAGMPSPHKPAAPLPTSMLGGGAIAHAGPSATRTTTASEPQGPRTSQNAAATTLPADWSEEVDPVSGHKYYFNKGTGESSWKKPGTTGDWTETDDPQVGFKFYFNVVTGSHHGQSLRKRQPIRTAIGLRT